ncbi:hypothetical protein CYMTET_49709 [Cymbomonas tetramitiformis]|uniref:Uncharacterized protein n=1 Tax=Cymbomonas tetramitiformis TaxID=36881 RepID=A0AAE0BPM0_9CHLO|nr:hypothetical protein CYMTET_49709 [Cymbomonas tetramitiformis]
MFWKVPSKDAGGPIAAPPGNNSAYKRCQRNSQTPGAALGRKCTQLQVEYARVHMLNCKEWNCLMNFAHPKACASSRIQHFKGDLKRRMIQYVRRASKRGKG